MKFGLRPKIDVRRCERKYGGLRDITALSLCFFILAKILRFIFIFASFLHFLPFLDCFSNYYNAVKCTL